MDHERLIEEINEKKRGGRSFYADLIALQEGLERAALPHYVKAQLYHGLSLDYAQSRDTRRAEEATERVLAEVELALAGRAAGMEWVSSSCALRPRRCSSGLR